MIADQAIRELIGARLRRCRLGVKGDGRSGRLSQHTAAAAVGITQASMSNYENGKRDIPAVVVCRLAHLYGREVTSFIKARDIGDGDGTT